MNLFETKVKYSKVLETGKEKTVTETFLLDAVSFSDAEERINKQLEPYITGEFSVEAIKKSRINEVINIDGSVQYKARVIIDKKSTTILVPADNVDEAYKIVDKSFESSISDYEISGIVDSKIFGYFPL